MKKPGRTEQDSQNETAGNSSTKVGQSDQDGQNIKVRQDRQSKASGEVHPQSESRAESETDSYIRAA
jgi:hypothetical protein